MKRLALVLLGVLVISACGSDKKDNQAPNQNNTAAVPNQYCAQNQYGCWPYQPQGYQPYGQYGCQNYGGYQPVMYPGYGMGCMPGNQFPYGYNYYYMPYSYYGSQYNNYYGWSNYGYNQFNVACDLYVSNSCPGGTICRDVGMGRVGICSQY